MKPFCIMVFAFLFEWAAMPGQNMTNSAGSESWPKHMDHAATWARCIQLLKRDTANTQLHYQLGICYLNSRSQKHKALAHFQRSLQNEATDPLKLKLLAEAEYAAGEHDQAMQHYGQYRTMLAQQNATFYLINDAEQRLELCRLGKEVKQLKEALSMVASSGSSINNTSLESSSAPPLRELSRASTLPDQEFFEKDDNAHLEKASYSLEDTLVNKEATVAASFDGQIMLIYRNDEGQGNLYLSMLEGNEWTAPDLVNRSINTNGWETGEYLSADGRIMYFTSDRPGGYGGKDIYKCLKLASGEWSKAINLGSPVNTPYDDEAPCVLPDGTTLYFSSNRNKSKSNFELYMTTFADSGKWTTPLNVGYPVKKESSIRENAKERDPAKDNYIVTFNTKKIPITLLRGKLSDENNKFPDSTEITILNNATGEISGIYHPDEKSGHYNLLLPAGRNNNVTFESKGYLFHSENADLSTEPSLYKVVTPTVLQPFKENSSEILNNVFFTGSSTAPHEHSMPELQKLRLFLKDNPGCSIELGCAGVANDNNESARLAEGRAKAVANYLLEKGIEKKRIITRAYVVTKKKRHRRKKVATLPAANQEKIEIKITEIQ